MRMGMRWTPAISVKPLARILRKNQGGEPAILQATHPIDGAVALHSILSLEKWRHNGHVEVRLAGLACRHARAGVPCMLAGLVNNGQPARQPRLV